MADYQYVDADNHYYEAEDAFTRHGDDDVKRYVRWVSEGKRRHIVFGSTMIGLPTRASPTPRSTRSRARCVPRAAEGAAGAQPRRHRHPAHRLHRVR